MLRYSLAQSSTNFNQENPLMVHTQIFNTLNFFLSVNLQYFKFNCTTNQQRFIYTYTFPCEAINHDDEVVRDRPLRCIENIHAASLDLNLSHAIALVAPEPAAGNLPQTLHPARAHGQRVQLRNGPRFRKSEP